MRLKVLTVLSLLFLTVAAFCPNGVSSADDDDLFMISNLSKIIRFQAVEIPPKTGTVQGVNCMSLRADEVTAITSDKVI